MSKPLRKASQQNYYGGVPQYPEVRQPYLTPVKPKKRVQKRVVHKKKTNPIGAFFAKCFALTFLAVIGIFVLPFSFNRISKQIIFGMPYKEVKADYNRLLAPTVDYLSNDMFLNKRLLSGSMAKRPEMTTPYITANMFILEKKLKDLMLAYPSIKPAIYVWEYEKGRYVDIDADKIYSAASIIKIPVLIQMFKSIEHEQFSIYDEMVLTDYYKASGSGGLQHKVTGSKYSMGELARYMIEDSDNSATNMIISKIGSMTDVNQALRNWGIKNTHVQNWLPDLAGTNYTTAKDLALMLYNLDNPGFLNINSREYIVDYMSHVKNTGLIRAGLDPKAMFVHKTGDIGKTLGDAGIVFTPQGKKYIVVILANRPYNSPLGKDFIQKASSLIYNSVVSGSY